MHIGEGNLMIRLEIKDTPNTCNNWLKSKASVYRKYFHTRIMWVTFSTIFDTQERLQIKLFNNEGVEFRYI